MEAPFLELQSPTKFDAILHAEFFGTQTVCMWIFGTHTCGPWTFGTHTFGPQGISEEICPQVVEMLQCTGY